MEWLIFRNFTVFIELSHTKEILCKGVIAIDYGKSA